MDSQRCQNCKRPLQPGQPVCECGAVVATVIPDLLTPAMLPFGLPGVSPPPIAAEKLDFANPGVEIGALPTGEHFDLGDVKLDFAAARIAPGRSYRPVAMIGKDPDGKSVLERPFGATWLAAGAIGVVDFVDGASRMRLQVFDLAGTPHRAVSEYKLEGDAEGFDTPAGIAVDAQGCFYVVDLGASRIMKLNTDGTVICSLGGEGLADDELMAPREVTVDASGNLYVADAGNNRILKWDPNGRPLLVLGINKPEEDADWLMAGEEPGEFDDPQGVAVDRTGNIFVADTNNHRVQKFRADGALLLVVGEQGDGPGQMRFPRRVRVDAKDNLYVVDSSGQRIQKFDAEGHFVYQLLLPTGEGAAEDFLVDEEGYLMAIMRQAGLLVKFEVM